VQGDVEEAHPLHVYLQDGDIGPEPGAHAGGVDAGDPSAQYHHLAGQDAGDSPQQDTAAAMVLGEQVSAHRHRHAAGDFTHWLQQGQPVVDFDGFKGDGGCP